MNKPNLFIIGAPKCGTTSLARWLSQNEQIFLPVFKEPHYFNSDSKHRNFFDLKSYLNLYEPAEKQHKVCIDASVWYYLSAVAVSDILKFNPAAKFIFCVRCQKDSVVSLHNQKVFSGDEKILSVEEAWKVRVVNGDRKTKVSVSCQDARQLDYRSVFLFGAIYENLLKQISPENIKIVFMEDIKEKPGSIIQELEQWLEVKEHANYLLETENASRSRKSIFLPSLLKYILYIKYRFKIKIGFGIADRLNKWNSKSYVRGEITGQFKNEVSRYFNEDIELLEQVTLRDLSNWKVHH